MQKGTKRSSAEGTVARAARSGVAHGARRETIGWRLVNGPRRAYGTASGHIERIHRYVTGGYPRVNRRAEASPFEELKFFD